jgi:hypothetical protein
LLISCKNPHHQSRVKYWCQKCDIFASIAGRASVLPGARYDTGYVVFAEPTTEERDHGQQKTVRISGGELAAGSLTSHPGFNIPLASNSNEKTPERVM